MNSAQPLLDSKTTVRLPYLSQAQAEFSLSQTLRRLAHISRREALAEELTGNLKRYTAAALEARRLWRDAKWHLQRARMNRDQSKSGRKDNGTPHH